ncbi:MAG: hypothetical protein NZ480_08560 [Bdellovibrionaceae bacterium]|nr:hypothetical protein [Pseudobdellovibrionaceae bacterium]MDW8190108.1 hypothetical protein [Pseudobdellovibrionaceae bacterium]
MTHQKKSTSHSSNKRSGYKLLRPLKSAKGVASQEVAQASFGCRPSGIE